MSLYHLVPEQPAYSGVLDQAANWLGYSPSANRRMPALWVAYGAGQDWNEVTETYANRPVQGVIVFPAVFTGPETAIAVAPDVRGRGLGTRLLRWAFTNMYDSFACRVQPNQREGLAFASKHGQYRRTQSGMFVFECSRETARLSHIGCSCSDCFEGLEFAPI
jgi:GNAT superfamily N-acetyltransferase